MNPLVAAPAPAVAPAATAAAAAAPSAPAAPAPPFATATAAAGATAADLFVAAGGDDGGDDDGDADQHTLSFTELQTQHIISDTMQESINASNGP